MSAAGRYIGDLDLAKVAAVLINNDRDRVGRKPITKRQARRLVKDTLQIVEIDGDPIRIGFTILGDKVDLTRYNQDNGDGWGERAIRYLRTTGSIEWVPDSFA